MHGRVSTERGDERVTIWASGAGPVLRMPWTRSVAAPAPDRRAVPLAVAAAVVGVLGLAVGLAGGPPAPAAPRIVVAGPCGPAWVTGWQAAAQPVPGPAGPGGATFRMVVRPQVTGSQVRVRLSNAYGATPLAVGSTWAARSDGAAGQVSGTARPVAFGGAAGVTIPPGGQVWSDPVPLVAQAGVPLAVSLMVVDAPAVLTGHAVALQTSYRDGAALDSWLVLTGVDVLAPRPENAVVAVGDSITDGVGSPIDADERWSDALATRLADAGGAADMAVLNAGISRNRLLAGDPADGDTPLSRFDRDVTGAAGATDVVLHIGTNDIAAGAQADAIVAGMRLFAERGRAAGKRVFLTTITPSTSGAHGTPAATATRDAVNAWVLAHGRDVADGVFDFAAAVADPARPTRLASAFDSGDGLHLSAAGYRALAATVDVGSLTGSPCLADTSPVRVLVRDGG
jgi:lysophospholipase L1-like esterase